MSFKSVLTIALSATLTAGAAFPPMALGAPSTQPVHASSLTAQYVDQRQNEITPAQAVSLDKAKDPAAFKRKVEMLEGSSALVALIPSGKTVEYLEFFAAAGTEESIREFVKKTEGKHFVVSGTPEDPNVKLVDGPAVEVMGIPTCVRGWTAAAVYFLASEGMTCAPLAAVSGSTLGIVCAGVFFAIGMLPDFNAPCEK